MLDRWCYCVDILQFLFEDDIENATVKEVTLTLGHFEAELLMLSKHNDNQVVHVHLSASKDVFEVPRWNVYVKGSGGSATVHNIGFPFVWHRIDVELETLSSNRWEKYYDKGNTTFEYQLESFVNMIRSNTHPSGTFGNSSIKTMRLIDRIRTFA